VSTAVILGLALQAICLVAVRIRLGRRWLAHIGALFILVAVMYHWVGEILWHLYLKPALRIRSGS
jgi:hypothetical protein